MTDTNRTAAPSRPNVAKVLGVSLVGTAIEWYDFGIYATASALVFPTVFFGGQDNAIMSSFLVMAVAMLARPLGAIVFGHIGDRFGRKFALFGSLGLMTVATLLIGILPGSASIGAAAIGLLLLIRTLQSFAVGGEWGGAVLYAVESAPPNRKALYGSFPQIGNGIGIFGAMLAFNLVSLQGHDFLINGGWRYPFLAAVVLGLLGMWLRWSVEDSPEFAKVREAEEKALAEGKKAKVPFFELIRTSWRQVLVAAGAFLITIGGLYIITSYIQARAVNVLGMSEAEVTTSGMVLSVSILVIIPLAALAGDKWGVRRVTLFGLALHVIVGFPMFWLVQTGTFAGLVTGQLLGNLASCIAYATIGTLVAGWFTATVRQSGLSLAYQIAGLIGGFTLVAAQALDDAAGGSWVPVAILFCGVGLLSFLCAQLWKGPATIAMAGTEVAPEFNTAGREAR